MTEPTLTDPTLLARLDEAERVAEERERAAEVEAERRAAAELDAIPVEVRKAAEMLGVPPREVKSVAASVEGVIVTTFDNTELVIVSPDAPDALGRSGLMHRDPVRYPTRLPVYARPSSPAEAGRGRGVFRRLTDRVTRTPTPPAPAERAERPDPSDDRLRHLDAMVAEAEAWVDDVAAGRRHQSEQGLAADQLAMVERLRSSYRANLRAADLDEHPAPPTPADVRTYTAAYRWARACLAATSDGGLAAARYSQVNMAPDTVTWNPGLAQNELDAAVGWFAQHGLPLPDEAPPVERPAEGGAEERDDDGDD